VNSGQCPILNIVLSCYIQQGTNYLSDKQLKLIPDVNTVITGVFKVACCDAPLPGA